MKIIKGAKLGNAIAKSAVKAYRKCPGDFNLAANAAAYYAAKQNTVMVVIPGNSYMSKVFHVVPEGSDLSRFTCGMGNKVIAIAVVDPDSTVWRAELSAS
jgi:hypothetical protein